MTVPLLPAASGTAETERAMEQLREANRQLEETLSRERAARDWLARLQSVTSALSRARSAEEIARVLIDEATRGLRVTSGAVAMLDREDGALHLLAPKDIPARVLPKINVVPMDAPWPLAEAARRREAIVLQTREQLVARFPDLAAALGDDAPHAAVALPLAVDDEVVGAIVVRSSEPRNWGHDELEFLDALSVQCAQALERVRLRELELRTHDEQAVMQRFLAHASRVLVEPLDANESLDRLTKLVVPGLADSCHAYVMDDAGLPQPVSADDADPAAAAELARIRGERPVAEIPGHPLHKVIATGSSYYRREVPEEDFRRAAGGDDHVERLKQVGWRSVLILPLIARGRTLGAVALGRRGARPAFTERDLSLLEALAARAAIAVDNAQLFRAAERARHDAEDANRAKSDFLAMMSHELRTPLNAIAGYLDLLRMELRGPLTNDQAADLDRIDLAQRRLLALINDVLNFAKLEAGRVEFHLQPVRVSELLDQVEPLLAPQIEVRGLEFKRVEVAGRDPLIALADPEKTQQVLLNLLSNAVKFTHGGGRISLLADQRDSRVNIHVSDTGIGIAPEKVDDIFEPFVQVDTSLTRTADGTGLGLAISRALAREMGGELTVRSVLGEGSTFTLSLPVP